VVGYVTNVGRTIQQKSGSKTLDFHLSNNRLYISSTSSTLIVDDEQILMLKRLKTDDSGVELTKEMLLPDNTEAKAETLENLLMWTTLTLKMCFQSSTFHCVVRIDKVRTKKGWNYPSCGGEKCKKGNLDRTDGQFWYDSCNSSVDYPVIRYRLELETSDATVEAVVVMFDETVKRLVKCSASSIVGSEDQEEGESGLPPAIVKEEDVVETGSSEMVAATTEAKDPMLKSLAATPFVPTLSKPGESKKLQRDDIEDSDTEESSVADSKAKGGEVGCFSDT
ncbi:ATP-dependent DNA helicase PIF2, partial [Tanacetum coccineum]